MSSSSHSIEAMPTDNTILDLRPDNSLHFSREEYKKLKKQLSPRQSEWAQNHFSVQREGYQEYSQDPNERPQVTDYKEIHLNDFQSFDSAIFDKLVTRIKKAGHILTVRLPTRTLSEDQLRQLKQLVGTNERKGLKIVDSEGIKLPYELDPTDYIAAKSNRIDYLGKIRETTKNAFETFVNEYNTSPKTVIDFGAGTGACTIALILLGCEKVVAVDGDEDSLRILQTNLVEEITERARDSSASLFYGSVECVTSPFISAGLPLADMLIASFTFPYRKPEDFLPMIEKAASSVRSGGILAGHLFTQPERGMKPGITYHTLEEAEQTLEKVGFDVKWIWKQEQGFEIWNGDNNGGTTIDDNPLKREWGGLIHFVARKRNS